MSSKRNCSECAYCISVDEGYSNYTVEGRTNRCTLSLHPLEAYDAWYGVSVQGEYASKCDKFHRSADRVMIDVDLVDLVGENPITMFKNYETEYVTSEMIYKVL